MKSYNMPSKKKKFHRRDENLMQIHVNPVQRASIKE
jgi:hypothetical protein